MTRGRRRSERDKKKELAGACLFYLLWYITGFSSRGLQKHIIIDVSHSHPF